MKGTWHQVGDKEDLPFLAAFYYGRDEDWLHIYWANIDIYGDDFEMIPCGTKVFIPDIENSQVTRKLAEFATGDSPLTNALGEYENDSFEGNGFRIVTDPNGFRSILFIFSDDTVLMSGPNPMEFAYKSLGITEDAISLPDVDTTAINNLPPGTLLSEPVKNRTLISNARGRVAEGLKDFDTTEYETRDAGVVRNEQVIGQYEASSLPVENMVRKACEIHYGHNYMYNNTLDANGYKATDIFRWGNMVKLPARGNKSKIKYAEMMRRKYANR